MILKDLDKYNQIVIQVHDNPDADAVGSGYALFRYFKERGKDVRLVYGGKFEISKSNMLLLISALGIPIEFVQELDNPELLITVDCQYGEGNVQKFQAQNIAMVDHHTTGRVSNAMAEIRSHLVSCATVCYALLREAGCDVNADRKVATALFYGLYMDSNQLTEISHPYDRDMVDFLKYDEELINRLKHTNISIEDFETAGIAILRHSYVAKHRLAIIFSKACDPNILGLIGDFALQVDCVDVCIVYSEYPGGYKLSVRSCLMEVAANELSGFLTADIGDGGGHRDKAGGFISGELFEQRYAGQSIEAFFFSRMDEYYDGCDTVYYQEGIKERKDLKLYHKRQGGFGYVRLSEMFEAGTECKIRTMEGDVFVNSAEDIYVMIGQGGEVYPIEKTAFETKYQAGEGVYDRVFEYAPAIIRMDENKAYQLLPFARNCTSASTARILARPLEKHTKVFSKWNYDSYMNGEAGDMLCYSETDETDVYVVKKDIFDKLYKAVE